ncbi:MAG: von Willebrand factor type A domain-containing protein [Calditrichaceae bacterium]|nr:von Willebrand factor type A domain-containing protein [Calditrichaceae bacterium]
MRTVLFLLITSIAAMLFAGTTGKIAGTVTEDQSGATIAGANVILVGTSLGSATDSNGNYTIINIPAGRYTLEVSMVGYENRKIKNVKVKADQTTKLDITLGTEKVKQEEVVEFYAPVEKRAMSDQVRGVATSIGYMGAVGGEGYIDYNTEEYDKIDESGFFQVIQKPMSTFAADVDAASYSNARRFIMQDQMPYKDAVRSEEFINYFSYDYKQPEQDKPLSINMEYSECPWNKDHNLIHIGLQGKKLAREEQRTSNLVFLIDVSGSMNSPKKLPLLKKSYKLLVEQLKPEDKIAIVVYAGSAGLVLPSTSGANKAEIIAAIERLQAGGSTAGGAGIQLAYNVAKENYITEGNNRVILATDGDFNVGISSTSELVRFIEERRDEGIFLTVLGFGMGNYKDNRLQELADRGNGNHAYIDNIMEAKKVLVNEITSTLFTIAKDVKIQVEFNPAKISSYRLIGYENRKLEDKDFTDDTKDAGEIGAGHTVTALYEVVPAGKENANEQYDLKYQHTTIKKDARITDEVLTVRIRYKEPDGRKSKEFSEALIGKPVKLSKSSNNFRFSAAVAEFSMILNDSEFKGDSNLESVKNLAKNARGDDPFGYRVEFLTLVDRVKVLKEQN